jgi:flagellar biosynthetic protein FlhB
VSETEQDRTEQPTSYKLLQARRRGMVARGMDLGFLIALATAVVSIWILGSWLWQSMASSMQTALRSAGGMSEGSVPLARVVEQLFLEVFTPILVFSVVLLSVAMVFEIVQTGVVFSAQPLKPDFSRLNPVQGLKKLFSLRMLVETFKNLLKLTAYTAVAVWAVHEALQSEHIATGDVRQLAASLAHAALRLIIAFALVALLFASADQIISRRFFLKNMRMSRREVKREFRDREGDPRLKQKRKQLHGEFVKLSQGLRNLRGADVVITNPTHYAVALRYDRSTMTAPMVVSLGSHQIAQRMKRMAMHYGIPVVESPALARELWRITSLNSFVPESCFAPVAEIYNRINRELAGAQGD